MQANHRRFHLGIFGGSGTGKTTYAMKYMASASAKCVFIYDAEGEFSERMKIPPARTTFELDQAILSGWVCYDPHTMFPGNLEDGLEYFARLALAAADRLPGRKLFAVDELGRYMSGFQVPQPLKVLIQTGRRSGLDGVWIGQQPNELHNTVRCQLSEVVCFQLTDETALEFQKKFGFDTEAVRNLAPFRFIARNNQGGEVRG